MAQGLGLGLSIVQRLVTALGLTLEVDSAEGRGSRFSLYLPAVRSARPSGERDVAAEPVFGTLNLKVLCVDNEVAILEGWYPDLVLMDYHLDQTSGLDAIEWLRHNLGGHLPAALVTADRSPAVRALAEDRGIAVVTKPVKPAALRATISGLSNQSGRSVRAS